MTFKEINEKVKMANTLTWGGAVAITAGYYLATDMRVKVAVMGAGVVAEIAGVKKLYDAVKAEWDVTDKMNKLKEHMNEMEEDITDVEWTIVEGA